MIKTGIVLLVLQLANCQPDPTLPTLPPEPLQIKLQATIFRNDSTSGVTEYTAYMEDYLDSAKGNGLSILINGSMETRYYYDLPNKEGMTLTRDILTTPLNQADCTVTPLTGSELYGGFYVRQKDGQLIIANVSSFFQWSKDTQATYIGPATVRGIPATQWEVTISYNEGTAKSHSYNFTYYFSDGHSMPYYGIKPLPLRIEFHGESANATSTRTFKHEYDFTLIAPLGDRWDNFFATPRGVQCPGRNTPTGLVPNFADQYSLSEEIVVPQQGVIMNSKIFFDYNLNLTRTDYQYQDNVIYGYANVKIVHDFKQNYQIFVFKDNGTCNITRIPTTPQGRQTWDISFDEKGNPKLIHTRDMPVAQNLQYQGKRTEKGVPVNVFANKWVFENGTNKVVEWWFLDSTWAVLASQTVYNSYSVFVGYYEFSYNRNTHAVQHVYQSNVYDQYYGPLQVDGNLTVDAFDISECYGRNAIANEHLSFKVLDTEKLFIDNKVTTQALTKAIRSYLLGLVPISPTRITDVRVYEMRDSSTLAADVLKVSFILHSKLLLTDPSADDFVNNEVENAEVLTVMETQMATKERLTLPVQAVDGHYSSFVVVELLSNDAGSVADEIGGSVVPLIGKPKKYSPAAMAGLGIGMLLLGAILTIATGAILWIKRADINIPYLSQSNE